MRRMNRVLDKRLVMHAEAMTLTTISKILARKLEEKQTTKA